MFLSAPWCLRTAVMLVYSSDPSFASSGMCPALVWNKNICACVRLQSLAYSATTVQYVTGILSNYSTYSTVQYRFVIQGVWSCISSQVCVRWVQCASLLAALGFSDLHS